MSRSVIDSYTGAEIAPEYVSKIKGINEPRTLYKKGEAWTCTAQYGVHPRDHGEKWVILREGCPEGFLPMFRTQAIALHVMNWLMANDGSVGVAIHWLQQGDAEPYMNMLQHVHTQAEWAENNHVEIVFDRWANEEPHESLGYIPPLD